MRSGLARRNNCAPAPQRSTAAASVHPIGGGAARDRPHDMRGGLTALRTAVLRTGALGYQYLPLPARWKDAVLILAFRLAGRVFDGERSYELWRRRGDAPPPPRVTDCAPQRARGL